MTIRDGYLPGLIMHTCPECDWMSARKDFCVKCGWKPDTIQVTGTPPQVKKAKMPWQ